MQHIKQQGIFIMATAATEYKSTKSETKYEAVHQYIWSMTGNPEQIITYLLM